MFNKELTRLIHITFICTHTFYRPVQTVYYRLELTITSLLQIHPYVENECKAFACLVRLDTPQIVSAVLLPCRPLAVWRAVRAGNLAINLELQKSS